MNELEDLGCDGWRSPFKNLSLQPTNPTTPPHEPLPLSHQSLTSLNETPVKPTIAAKNYLAAIKDLNLLHHPTPQLTSIDNYPSKARILFSS
jgi:hypothetical protein